MKNISGLFLVLLLFSNVANGSWWSRVSEMVSTVYAPIYKFGKKAVSSEPIYKFGKKVVSSKQFRYGATAGIGVFFSYVVSRIFYNNKINKQKREQERIYENLKNDRDGIKRVMSFDSFDFIRKTKVKVEKLENKIEELTEKNKKLTGELYEDEDEDGDEYYMDAEETTINIDNFFNKNNKNNK